MSKACAWAAVVLAATLAGPGRPARAEEPEAGPMAVWQLPAGARPAPEDLPSGHGTPAVPGEARKGWKRLDAERAKGTACAGGVALESPALVVVIPAGGGSVAVLTKGRGSARPVRQDLVLVDAKGQAGGALTDIRLTDSGASEAVASFSAGGLEARAKVGLGRPLVEVIPGKGSAAIQVRGEFRFSFVPDFFGDDVLYDAREIPASRVYPPAENFLVNLMEGHSVLTVLVWPRGGGEEVFLQASGEGPRRRFSQAQVSFGGKSVFVGVLTGEGIWFDKDLTGLKTDKVLAAEGWQRPFPAQWMTILANRPRVGAPSGMASRTMPVRPLGADGDDPYSDVYVHPRVPSWFFGNEWRLYLQTTLTHMMTKEKVTVPEFLVAINYPRDRVKETPLDAYTLVDVMMGALGRGPCEYILDLEGLNRTRSTGAADTGKPTVAATCSAHGALVNYYLGERSESARRDEALVVAGAALSTVEGISDFLDAAYARIQEYLSWSDGLVALAEKTRAANPQAGELADRIIPIAREMRELWDKMVRQDKPCANPMEWRLALEHCKNLIRTGAPDLGMRVHQFDPQMRGAGEEVDGGMQACRMIVRRIRQEAAVSGAADPAALEFAAAVRRRCQQILRNKHYKEGGSVSITARSETQ